MCVGGSSPSIPDPAPPVAPPDVLEQEAPEEAKKKKSKIKRAASGTKALRTLSIGSGTVNSSTRSGGLNI